MHDAERDGCTAPGHVAVRRELRAQSVPNRRKINAKNAANRLDLLGKRQSHGSNLPFLIAPSLAASTGPAPHAQQNFDTASVD